MRRLGFGFGGSLRPPSRYSRTLRYCEVPRTIARPKKTTEDIFQGSGELVVSCCVGFKDPLRQHFSLSRVVSPREREREKEEKKKCPNNPNRIYSRRGRPLPFHCPNQKDAPAMKVSPPTIHGSKRNNHKG